MPFVDENSERKNGIDNLKTMSTHEIVPITWSAVRALIDKVEQLERRLGPEVPTP